MQARFGRERPQGTGRQREEDQGHGRGDRGQRLCAGHDGPRELEARQDQIEERLSAVPADMPDIHPKIAGIYRRKVERFAAPRDRDEAEQVKKGGLIERHPLSMRNAALLGRPRHHPQQWPWKGATDTPGCANVGPDSTPSCHVIGNEAAAGSGPSGATAGRQINCLRMRS